MEQQMERTDRGAVGLPNSPGRWSQGGSGTGTVATTGAKLIKRVRLECQASVARPKSGVMPAHVAPPPAPAPGESVRIGDVDVAIKTHADGSAGPERKIDEVGELDHMPQGSARVGDVTAECRTACSS